MDAVCYEALESIDFRYESIENHPKVLILQGFYGSGTGGREFESRHFDHMKIIRTFSYLEKRSDYLFYSSIPTLIVRNENSHR